MHCRWFTLTQLDGSLSAFYYYVQRTGIAGLRSAWPWPSAEAAAHVACFGALQAALQLGLPGRTFKGPVSPRGNVPVYKVPARAGWHRAWPCFIMQTKTVW